MKSKFSLRLLVIALILIIPLFSAVLFESLHAGHEGHCHEENCSVCFVLQVIHNTKKASCSENFKLIASFAFQNINLLIFSAFIIIPPTLVSQKIKLVI